MLGVGEEGSKLHEQENQAVTQALIRGCLNPRSIFPGFGDTSASFITSGFCLNSSWNLCVTKEAEVKYFYYDLTKRTWQMLRTENTTYPKICVPNSAAKYTQTKFGLCTKCRRHYRKIKPISNQKSAPENSSYEERIFFLFSSLNKWKNKKKVQFLPRLKVPKISLQKDISRKWYASGRKWDL